jgi:hypothetical protein
MLGVGADARGENRLLTMNLVLWAVMGFAVIIAQRVSWWQYHYLLLLVPLGLLGARGASMLWQVLEPWGRRRVRWLPSLRAAGALLLFAGIIGSAVARGALLAHERLALRPADRARYQMRMGKAYAQALPEVAFLGQPGRLPGAIFVIGGQEYYYLSGRPQAGHPKGNRFFKFLTPGEWDRLAGDLAAAPPSYVFVQSDHLDIVRRPARATARFRQFLEGRYRQVRSSAAGVWYERREAGAQPQASGTTRPVCRATSRCRSWATFTTGTGDQRHPTLRGAMAARDYSMTVMRRVAS